MSSIRISRILFSEIASEFANKNSSLEKKNYTINRLQVAYNRNYLVNTDPTKPWVKIVEADGDDALLRARDHGSAGDVFEEGERFGHTGNKIWNNRGMLVQWTATVIEISESSATIALDYVGDANSTLSSIKTLPI